MSKVISFEEFKTHSKKEDLWVLLHSKVYDVSKFIDEHPGGDEVLLAEAGRDATEAFEDVGHSDEARALLPDMFIGDIEPTAGVKKAAASQANRATSTSTSESKVSTAESGSSLVYLAPIGLLLAYFVWNYYAAQYKA